VNSQKAKLCKGKYVFISHSTKDTWIAEHIAADIKRKGRESGVGTFIDSKDIGPAELIDESIRRNLRECSKFIVLLSSASVNREWVLIETGAAWGLRKPIVALLDKIAPSQIPKAIAPRKAIDLNDLEKNLAYITR
jgi:hypothetical protein